MDALSPQEQRASEILASYGIDFTPAYIGRARRYFGILERTPGAQQIVDYVIELINLDEKQRQFIETRIQQIEFGQIGERIELSGPDRQAAVDLANALREIVDLERSKIKASHPEASPAGARITIYDNQRTGIYSGNIRLLGRVFIIRARIFKDQNAINLEFKIP